MNNLQKNKRFKKRIARLTMEMISNDNVHALTDVSVLLLKNKAEIIKAEIGVAKEKKGETKFTFELKGEEVPFLLKNLDIFFSENPDYSKYHIAEDGNNDLVHQFNNDIDHKKKIIECSKNISEVLIDYAKKDPSLIYTIPPNVFEELVAEIFAS